MNLNWQKKFKNMVIHHIRSQFLSVFSYMLMLMLLHTNTWNLKSSKKLCNLEKKQYMNYKDWSIKI